MTTALGYQLDRIVTIKATPEIVFGFFTDSARWASWWGTGSSIDPTPGGRALILHPGGVETSGEVLEVEPPSRFVFTYGFASGTPFPPGSSRVTIRLQSVDEGTQLHLTHEFPAEAGREDHVQGWRYQLSLFANLVANEVNRQAERQVDAWYEAWSTDDSVARGESLSRIAAPHVTFNDRFSHTEGLADLAAHLDAARRHMPGLTLQREGAVRQCQGCALSDWTAVGTDGQQKARGTNVFAFDATGRITAVTGFWMM
jgi:uncharacterized protein YndB with AHSA1/START domain